MPSYRCYFLDYQDHIQAAENIEADGLDEAIEHTLAMLRQRPQYHSIELWQGALRLCASRGQLPRHHCHIYRGAPSKILPAMAEIIKQQLKQNTRCLYLNSPPMVIGLKYYLTTAGVDVKHQIAKGALILSSDQDHLVRGYFDADLMLNMLEDAVHQALNDGYKGLWATGDMSWELGTQRDAVDLLEYEWQLEQIFRRQPALSGICQYHADTLPRNILRQGLVTHPSIFVNETLSRINPHYLPQSFDGRDISHPELDNIIDRLRC
jgi:hypothetical protein